MSAARVRARLCERCACFPSWGGSALAQAHCRERFATRDGLGQRPAYSLDEAPSRATRRSRNRMGRSTLPVWSQEFTKERRFCRTIRHGRESIGACAGALVRAARSWVLVGECSRTTAIPHSATSPDKYSQRSGPRDRSRPGRCAVPGENVGPRRGSSQRSARRCRSSRTIACKSEFSTTTRS